MTTGTGAARPLALLGCTVVDVTAAACLEDRTVLVVGERIAAVGPAGTVAVPPDARRVDATGRWVLPGLVDMHCHVTAWPPDEMPLELFLVNGVTTVRDPGGRMTDQRLLRDAVRRGERVGPRLRVAGEFLDGAPPVWPDASFVVDTPERATAAVAHLAAQGADLVKVYNHVSAEALVAIVAAAREHGLPVAGHVPRRLSLRRAVELGLTGLEHVRVTGSDFLPAAEAAELDLLPVARREPLLWQRIDPEAGWVDALVATMVAHDVTLDPTLLVDETTYVDRGAGVADHPDNAYLPAAYRDRWTSRTVPPSMRMPDELAGLARDGHEKRKRFVARCAEAGVRIVAGTDGAGGGRLLPGFGLHHELALLRGAGLSPYACLRAATIDAATALGTAAETGSVTAGKLADLGVWTADPLRTHLRPADLETVVLGGTAYDPADLYGHLRAGQDPDRRRDPG